MKKYPFVFIFVGLVVYDVFLTLRIHKQSLSRQLYYLEQPILNFSSGWLERKRLDSAEFEYENISFID